MHNVVAFLQQWGLTIWQIFALGGADHRSVLRLRVKYLLCSKPSGISSATFTLAVLRRLAPGIYCGRMGAAVCGSVPYGGGIVGVFSVVAGWFGGVFRVSLECYS